MYLKRLELQGFKTFAIPTELEFPPGITAIVGPNGSGKSNLFDAIRWVLGETSVRTLRGTRMEDVIFAGSERRRALGLATVSLTLDNTSGLLPVDFTEVTVTRRATRGGEGEYFLNGVPCRLRDIQNLFLGTGLGGRSYALIGQGEVDAILDATPEERRFLLEEAAGLARYKRRKVEAERRLASVGQNLLRLGDLVRELESQLASLAQQAEVAERYQSYVQELRTLEVSLLVDDARRLERSLRRLASQLEEVRGRLEDVRRDRERAATELQEARARVEEATRNWEEAQRDLVRTLGELADLESAARLLEEKIRANRAQEERLLHEVREIEEALGRSDEEIRSLREKHQELLQRKASLLAAIAQEEQAMAELSREGSEGQGRLEALRADVVELARARSQAHNEMATLQARASRLQAQVEGTQEQEARLLEEMEELERRRLALLEEVEAVSKALSNAEEGLDQIRARESALREELEALRKQEQALSMERQALLSRLQYLEDAQAHYAGYDAGTQDVLLARREDPGRFPGVVGALGDLVQVPPHLRKAVEAALQSRLSVLITQTWEEAKGVLLWLKERGTGISVLPLDLLPSLPPPPEAISGQKIVGRAVDFVQGDGRIQDVLRAFLAGVLIVEDFETALRLHREGYPWEVVTLEGETVSAEGVVRLPGRGNQETKVLGRREEVEGARRALSAVEGRLQEMEGRRRDLAVELARTEARASEAGANVQDLRQVLVERQKEVALLEEQLVRIPTGIQEVRATRETLSEEMEEVARRIQALEREILELENELEGTEQAAQQLQSEARAVEERRRVVQERLLALRVSLAEANGSLEGLSTRLREREEERERMRNRSRDLLQEVEALRAERAELERTFAETQGELQSLQESAGQVRERLSSWERARERLSGEVAGLEEEWRRCQGVVAEHEEVLHRLEIKHAQLDAEVQGRKRRIEEEFGLAWEEAVQHSPRGMDRDAALGRIESLRGLIAALGPVNLRAIEERDQVEARLRSLRAYIEDLAATREALGDLIGHIDSVLRVRFKETFTAVNREFGALFERLFNGGRAHLELVSPEAPGGWDSEGGIFPDPTGGEGAGSSGAGTRREEGIEVFVQLPGKKRRPISSLSGGERVMVALALIFAMLRVHPSPFCVFDEVDAALDDVNTGKFTTLLRELAERTQVIVITHNKGTMEASDVLYGVTMEEPGVSKLVSMRLVERAIGAEARSP